MKSLTTRETFSCGSILKLQRYDYLVNRNVRAEAVGASTVISGGGDILSINRRAPSGMERPFFQPSLLRFPGFPLGQRAQSREHAVAEPLSHCLAERWLTSELIFNRVGLMEHLNQNDGDI
jgi:hypothetical protein